MAKATNRERHFNDKRCSMSAKIKTKVRNQATGEEKSEITDVGVWEVLGIDEMSSKDPARVTFRKGSGGDPVGTVLSMGVQTGALVPEEITGAAMTAPTLATTTATLPVRIYPDGKVCVIVTTYVAPIVVEVIQ